MQDIELNVAYISYSLEGSVQQLQIRYLFILVVGCIESCSIWMQGCIHQVKTEKQFIGIKLIYDTEIYRQSRAKHGDIVVQIISNLSLSLI